MNPVRTAGSNFIYRGSAPEVADAWVERHSAEHAVYMVWEPTPDERAALAAGQNLRLGIHGMEPIPPVSLTCTREQALSEVGAQLRDRALEAIVASSTEDSPRAPGWWTVSPDVWAALERENALDPSEGVPTLWGRPLLTTEAHGSEYMAFTAREREGQA